MDRLESITGTWLGTYDYDLPGEDPSLQATKFVLTLEQGWFGLFSGTVTDDPVRGMPGTGTIQGKFSFPVLTFTKQMPICYVTGPEGTLISLRAFLNSQGFACDRDYPHFPIHYEGKFQDRQHAQGTWLIEEGELQLDGGYVLSMPQFTGTWRMEAVA